MTRFRDKPEYQRGVDFEKALSRYLQKLGWGVLPVYDYSGAEDKAPVMHCGSSEGLILPDFFIAKAGKTFWAEAKRKDHADYTWITGHHETGINRRPYEHYCAVKKLSGIDVYLFFGHEAEDSVRYVEVDKHIPRWSRNFNHGRGGYFWIWDSLPELCKLSDLLPAIKDVA